MNVQQVNSKDIRRGLLKKSRLKSTSARKKMGPKIIVIQIEKAGTSLPPTAPSGRVFVGYERGLFSYQRHSDLSSTSAFKQGGTNNLSRNGARKSQALRAP